MLQPLLAIDGGTVGVIVFITISFISWLMNTIQAAQKQQELKKRRQHQQQQPGRVRAQQGGKDQLQSEIESFLQEVTGRQQQAGPPKPPALPRPQQQPPRAQRPRRPAKPKSPPVRPALTGTPKEPAELGASVRQHVAEHLQPRLPHEIEQHVQADITQHVGDHIGRETVTDDHVAQRPRADDAAARIRAMLADPQGVRRGIIVSEVLNRRKPRR